MFCGVRFDFSDGATVEEDSDGFVLPLPENIETGFVSSTFKEFYDCVQPKLSSLVGRYDELWLSYANITKQCDDLEAYKAFDLRAVESGGQTKYIAYPRKDEDLTVVSIGIGQDVGAEIKLREMYPRFQFFGVDSNSHINRKLFEKKLGGKFFLFSISGHNGIGNSSVFKTGAILQKAVKTIDLDAFLADEIGKQRIDVVLINSDENQYAVLEQIHSDGALDRKKVKICQMNVEVHKETYTDAQKFHDFVWKILNDKRYILMKSTFIHSNERQVIRLLLVNIADKECTDLFSS